MSPVTTSQRPGTLEHPEQAFAAYRSDGVTSVLCEEKHMGSRAVLLVCRSPDVPPARFGLPAPAAETAQAFPAADAAQAGPAADAAQAGPAADAAQAGPACGAIWTRTGRPFLSPALTASLIDRVRAAAEATGLFAELGTSWLLFDAELLPWNLKAGPLVRDQYATVAAAAAASLPAAAAVLEQASARALGGLGGLRGQPDDAAGVAALLGRTQARSANAAAFTAAYLRYCWPTAELAGVRVAPFQLLASEGAVYHERPHLWHLDVADRLAAAAPDLIATTRRIAVEIDDPASAAAATQWWQDLTDAGGEGMVVKPAANLTRGDAPVQSGPGRSGPSQSGPSQSGPSQSGPSQSGQGRSGLVQPGLKVRGREYLRIIYGPDYTEPANLDRLRQRAVGHKRSLALREYALGLEALDRVARGEPLWRVHECVFAVLALESEPVDPRL